MDNISNETINVKNVKLLLSQITHKRLADVFRFISFTPHETYGPHEHLRIEINYVMRGNCFLDVKGQRLKFQHGEMMIIPSFTPHLFESGAHGCTLMQLEFQPELIPTVGLDFQVQNCLQEPPTVIRIIHNAALVQTIRSIISELTGKQTCYEQLVLLHYAELQLYLHRYFEENFLPQNFPTALKQAVNHIRTHYSATLTIRELAKDTGVSERYLRRLFSLYLKTNPIDFLNRTRINKAAELLSQTSLSVKEVCFQCGFHSQAHFSRLFKRYKGCLPNKFGK